MFSTHKINTNNLSIKNLILLFLTIVFGFASVITLAQISIPSSIDNARQTIMRVTITDDGTDSATKRIEFSSGGIYIDDSILSEQSSFSGKVLGLDHLGNVIYTYSENLVVSGVSGGGGIGDAHWSGDNGADIWNLNAGNVGIGTTTMSGKLHVKSAGETDVYIEETSVGNAANLNLKNTIRTRAVGGDSNPDLFYIGIAGGLRYFTITPLGRVGIGIDDSKANLHVIGNFIAGSGDNIITGNYSSIIAGVENTIDGNDSIVGGGYNTLDGTASAIIAGTNNRLNTNKGFIGAGSGNTITGSEMNSIVGGENNEINVNVSSKSNFIGGGENNSIYDADKRGNNVIGGGGNNEIIGNANYNVIGGGDSNTIKAVNGLNTVNGFIGGGTTNTISGGNSTTIVGGAYNEITSSANAFIGGGVGNKITSSANTHIGGGDNNIIITSAYSVIPGGFNNFIKGSPYSFAAGVKVKIINYSNTFVRNSDFDNDFSAERRGSFLINVPMGNKVGGVGINTPNPQAALHVSGHILGHSITLLQENTGLLCGTPNKGQIILSGNNFFGCNGSIRKQLDN